MSLFVGVYPIPVRFRFPCAPSKDFACDDGGEFAIIPCNKKVGTSAMAKTRKAMFAFALALTWAGSVRTAAESVAEPETSTPPLIAA